MSIKTSNNGCVFIVKHGDIIYGNSLEICGDTRSLGGHDENLRFTHAVAVRESLRIGREEQSRGRICSYPRSHSARLANGAEHKRSKVVGPSVHRRGRTPSGHIHCTYIGLEQDSWTISLLYIAEINKVSNRLLHCDLPAMVMSCKSDNYLD